MTATFTYKLHINYTIICIDINRTTKSDVQMGMVAHFYVLGQNCVFALRVWFMCANMCSKHSQTLATHTTQKRNLKLTRCSFHSNIYLFLPYVTTFEQKKFRSVVRLLKQVNWSDGHCHGCLPPPPLSALKNTTASVVFPVSMGSFWKWPSEIPSVVQVLCRLALLTRTVPGSTRTYSSQSGDGPCQQWLHVAGWGLWRFTSGFGQYQDLLFSVWGWSVPAVTACCWLRSMAAY